ncbi:MAG: hypothetical protein IPN08_17820 [Bacteroidales bacterium]|nr:hypothetical protein [Bacteroidales bacterium]
MGIAYNFVVENELLRVKASGKDGNLDEVKAYGMSIIKAALDHGSEKVLCDESGLEYTLGTIDTFESARYISEYAPKIARIAIVCRSEDYDAAVFWQTVAVNRGLLVKVFNRVDIAEEWLNQP